MRDGRVDLHRLVRLEDAAVLFKRRQRAHVVQAVGKLDDDDADVLAHRDEHLADRGRLLVGQALDFDLRDLGHAFDQLRDLRIEGFGQFLVGDLGVFDRIVKKGRRQRVHVHLEVGQDDRDLDRMLHERLAALATLALMGGGGEAVCAFELAEVFFGKIRPGEFGKLREPFVGSRVRVRGRGRCRLDGCGKHGRPRHDVFGSHGTAARVCHGSSPA